MSAPAAGSPDGGRSAPPPRVAVRAPRHARRASGRPALEDLDEQTQLGEVLVRGLRRAQLTLALRLAALVACVFGGFPLLLATVPELRRTEVLGLPLPWLALGVLAYPLLVAAGWAYVRLAERNEREFTELVDRS